VTNRVCSDLWRTRHSVEQFAADGSASIAQISWRVAVPIPGTNRKWDEIGAAFWAFT